MKLTFLGAAETVTGSKYLVSFNHFNLLVDCGLYQGRKALRLRNWQPMPFDPATLDAVVLTHAHIDHTGYLPRLIKGGFKGPVYCTEGTKDLCAILLPDCGHLQEEEANRANKRGYSKHHPAQPFYSRLEGEAALSHFKPLPFHQPFQLAASLSVEFLPAGHIIGAAFVRIHANGQTLLLTGDMGRPHDPMMKAPTVIQESDYVVMESTYGNRRHEAGHPKTYLKEIINQTAQRGGTIVISSFAVGRTQATLYYIYLLKQEKAIPDLPVFIDSPMAVNATHILLKHQEELRITAEVCRQMHESVTYVTTPEDSKALDQSSWPKIIISASGMATGGRVLFHLQTYGGDSKNTLLFTGYQAEGTRGDRLMKGEKEIKIHGEMVKIRAQVAALSNTSAHADYEELLAWCRHYKQAPQKIFITHGEPAAAHALKEKIEQQLGWTCEVPQYLQCETLGEARRRRSP